ncbi:MAG: hypothetical protein QOD94_3122 [Alphaproteobacteria bacterium]|nr:hypothetical protein [Alphaproteobacteria bacterium]
MIKDVMVRLEGTAGDDARLSAAQEIIEIFDGRVIALYINILPLIPPDEESGIYLGDLMEQTRTAGDKTEAALAKKLERLGKPTEIRRHDVFANLVADIAAREARAADVFVALRPNGRVKDTEGLVESVLFGSGHHLFLVPGGKRARANFDHVLVAWNGSREAARAVSEAMPYLLKARTVTIIVVHESQPTEAEAKLGTEAVKYLLHHGVDATHEQVIRRNRGVGATLIDEARKREADMIVMGGYGHSRLREWLLGGTTYELIHETPVPLLLAH